MTVMVGDCRDILQTLPDNSVDSIVTDPPYEIGFMGKGWDGSGVANDPKLWAECYRVLKPGGHVLAFGAARTYHRMACAIEDAGFEIRDSIHWVYGSGFPKSHNVSKGIDRKRYDRAEVLEVTAWIRETAKMGGISSGQIDGAFGFAGMAGHWMSSASQPAVPTLEQVPLLLDLLGHTVETVPPRIGHLLLELNGRKGQPGAAWYDREIIGTTTAGLHNKDEGPRHTIGAGKAVTVDITAPATVDARQWDGWGTALKPAHEPIVMARKPFAGTVAQNVLEHGTGALNIDRARIGSNDGYEQQWDRPISTNIGAARGRYISNGTQHSVDLSANKPSGRWPANVILTHSTECGPECTPDCPAREIDRQSGNVKDGIAVTRNGGGRKIFGKPNDGAKIPDTGYGDKGGASRYFAQPEWTPGDYLASVYTPKAGKKERNAGLDGMPTLNRYKAGGVGGTGGMRSVKAATESKPVANHHPTVKPVALMRYLIRLVTPPGGTVLDPFLGSGTTAVAAILEKFEWIGCELTADYLPIIAARTANAANDYPVTNTIQNPDNTTQTQMGLFDTPDQ